MPPPQVMFLLLILLMLLSQISPYALLPWRGMMRLVPRADAPAELVGTAVSAARFALRGLKLDGKRLPLARTSRQRCAGNVEAGGGLATRRAHFLWSPSGQDLVAGA
jgi:hypothetical protein